MATSVSYDVENLPPDLVVRKGDRLWLRERRIAPAPFVVDPEGVARGVAIKTMQDLNAVGILATAEILRAEWIGVLTYEFTVVTTVLETDASPFGPPILDSNKATHPGYVVAIILAAAAAIIAVGYTSDRLAEWTTTLEDAPETRETLNLGIVALVLIVAFWLLAKKA